MNGTSRRSATFTWLAAVALVLLVSFVLASGNPACAYVPRPPNGPAPVDPRRLLPLLAGLITLGALGFRSIRGQRWLDRLEGLGLAIATSYVVVVLAAGVVAQIWPCG